MGDWLKGIRRTIRPSGRGSLGWLLAAGACAVLGFGEAAAQPKDLAGRLNKVPFIKLERAAVEREASDHTGRLWRERYQSESVRRRLEIDRLLGPRKVSTKSHALLRERGLGPALFDDVGAGAAGKLLRQEADTLRILLVRIGFREDSSGNLTSVTTDGDFQLGPAAETDLIDPPPHNRSFYEMHMIGLSEYYRLQSGGRLAIDFRVLPEGENDSCKLSDLADYGPGAGNGWTIEGLERLVRDMIAVADTALAMDADEGFSLADFDDDDPLAYVIFVHAGSDWQSDINGDSPNDIPTFFVNLGEPTPLLGVDRENFQTGELSECSVIPETTSQDGFFGSIAAGLYHEFGHALGLVDIYSTGSGLPQVGVWDLMDAGTNLIANVGFPNPEAPEGIEVLSVVGLLPPSLGVWEKWFLGWVEPVDVAGPGEIYRLPAIQVPLEDYPRYRSAGYDFRVVYPTVMRGGASPREFFLIENRWVPEDGSELPETTGIGFVRDEQTGVILYMGGDPDPISGLPRNTGMYDFFLPASGLLVWHVNMDRIEANLQQNTVNYWGDGLRLVEADGIQDIGVLEPYVLGFFGSETDPFNEDNGDALYAEGAPSSRCFDRSWSGLEMAEIQGAAGRGRSVMEFFGSVTPLSLGTPWISDPIGDLEAAPQGGEPGPRALDSGSLTPFVLGGQDVLVMADAPGPLWSGSGFLAKLFVVGLQGEAVASAPVPDWPVSAAWELGAPLAGPPLVAERAAGPLIVGLKNGTVLAFTRELSNGAELQTLSGPVVVGDSLAYAPVEGEISLLLCCVHPDSLVLLDQNLQMVGQPLRLAGAAGGLFSGFGAAPLSLNPPAAGLDAGFAVFAQEGWYRLDAGIDGLGTEPEFRGYDSAPIGTLRRALVPRQGEADLLVFDARECIGAWRIYDGGQVAALEWHSRLQSGPITEPAVADLSGNGENDLILATAQRLHAVQADGTPITGFPVRLSELFPLPDTTRIAGPVVVADATGDGINEIFFNTDLGHLIGLDARGRLLPRMPFLWGSSEAGALFVGPAAGGSGRVLWRLEAAGSRGAPMERRLKNGRLIGYRWPDSDQAAGGTSEWSGAGGSRHRRGPEGAPRSTGIDSPFEQQREQVVLYPNPLATDELNVRFFSKSDGIAKLKIYNLEGEIVTEQVLPAAGGKMNDRAVSVAGLATGLYVCQLEWEAASGPQKTLMNLAVAR